MLAFLFGIEPGDPFLLFMIAVLPAVVGLIACLNPARRAMNVLLPQVAHVDEHDRIVRVPRYRNLSAAVQ